MEDAPRRSRSLPILLGLLVLSQLTIANEIRYQGCLERQLDTVAMIQQGNSLVTKTAGCYRIPRPW